MEKRTNHLHTIDFLKFALLFPILIYHLFGEFAFKYVNELKPVLSSFFTAKNGYIAADLFFIISGYFLYKSILKNPEINLLDFAIKRLKRLLPILIISLVLVGIFNLRYNNNLILLFAITLTLSIFTYVIIDIVPKYIKGILARREK